MSVGKSSIRRAASAGTKKTAAKTVKAVAAEAQTTEVKQSVLTPMDCEEIQVKFLSGKTSAENQNRPVRLTEEMPDYLL